MRLEYIGKPGPWRDLQKFIDQVKFKKPQITQWELMKLVHQVNARNRPRHNHQQFTLFGQDIMTEDVQNIPNWSIISPEWRNLVPKFPIHSGARLDESNGAALQAIINLKKYNEVNRSTFIVPAGLSQTYVWSPETLFVQDVADCDIDLIRQYPKIRSLFRPLDLADGPQLIQSIDLPVENVSNMSTGEDAAKFAVEYGIAHED